MSGNYTGNQVELSSSLKPGLLRQGGEQAPKVKTWWPHDFVFGFGKRYEDLDQVQWTLGYAAIVEQEPDPYISKLMLVHLQNLMEDAQFSGFEAAKYAPGMILSQLERGRFTWADTLTMSEVRRSAINAKSTELMNSVQAAASSRVSRQGFVQSSSGAVSNNNNSQTFKGWKKCLNYVLILTLKLAVIMVITRLMVFCMFILVKFATVTILKKNVIFCRL
jgi:hypothetical protein